MRGSIIPSLLHCRQTKIQISDDLEENEKSTSRISAPIIIKLSPVTDAKVER